MGEKQDTGGSYNDFLVLKRVVKTSVLFEQIRTFRVNLGNLNVAEITSSDPTVPLFYRDIGKIPPFNDLPDIIRKLEVVRLNNIQNDSEIYVIGTKSIARFFTYSTAFES